MVNVYTEPVHIAISGVDCWDKWQSHLCSTSQTLFCVILVERAIAI